MDLDLVMNVVLLGVPSSVDACAAAVVVWLVSVAALGKICVFDLATDVIVAFLVP